jgi:steroid 5-alpha reductase family enzyme
MELLDTWTSVTLGAIALSLVWGACWAVGGLRAGRNDVVDVAWGLWFPLLALLVGGAVVFPRPLEVPRAALVLSLVILWGLRLAVHIGRRQLRSEGEDRRYAALRERFGRHAAIKSVVLIYLAQPLLAVVIAQPVLVAVAIATTDGDLWWLDVLACAVAVAGIVLEATADLQLDRFLARRAQGAASGGRYLTSGAWAWSRHPNYAGDAIAWIGFGLFGVAAAIASDAAWLVVPSILGPVVMWAFLRYGSGVPTNERGRAGNPEWDAYVECTSTFWPRPPRRSPSS